MDIFFEQILKKRKTVAEIATVLLIYAAGLLLGIVIAIATFLFLPSFFMFGLLICGLVFYGAIKLTGQFNIEYEYSVTNGTFDIDRIINRNRRVRMISTDIAEFDSFEKFDPEKYKGRSFDLKVIAAGGDTDDEIYCAVTRVPSKGRVLLVFQPDERVLGAVKKALPARIRREFERG